jgi:hypothetical protein
MSLFYALKGVKVTVIFSLRARKSDNFRERASKKKQRTDTQKDAKRIKSDNFIRGNREMNDWMAA